MYELLGWIFDLDATNVGRLIVKLTPLIEIASDSDLALALKNIHKKRKKIRSWEEFVKQFPDLTEIIIDATEQQIKRPFKKRKQKKVYSGKKHIHSFKTQITISKDGGLLTCRKSIAGVCMIRNF